MESLVFIKNILNDNFSLKLSEFLMEKQNFDYEGFSFEICNKTFRSRRGKLTPKKEGYFVSFWEKDFNGKNKAYDGISFPEKLIINILDGDKKGQFVFPKKILSNKKILKDSISKGKMAMRVYPNWCDNLNSTAMQTQKWQSNYFIDFSQSCKQKRMEILYFDS